MFLSNTLVALAAMLSLTAAYSGRGTVYYQDGATGSCGQANPDSSVIAAISNAWMDNQSPSQYCGRQIRVENVGSNSGTGGQGNTITVTVADTCPSCGQGDIDFSVGAWNQLTNNAAPGTFQVNWNWV